ncbi:transporter [Lithospermum erythrorhizon]|uniref:Transporter n=1 Tax=Lithospermum erythrorhizon TaxID=34254 RepID=A0AAV3RX47_LITER
MGRSTEEKTMMVLRSVNEWHWENAVAGSLAGLATVTFTHPLDVVRTRFQVNDGRVPSLPSYKSTPHAIFSIARNEGFRGLYSGFYPAILGSTVSWGLYFFFYSKAKERYLKSREKLSPVHHLAAAAEAGGLVSSLALENWHIIYYLQFLI